MCGIVAVFNVSQSYEQLRSQILKMAAKLRHRGPDWSGIYSCGNAILAHERLAIVDPISGKQPLFSKDKKLILSVNGEIYNHREIRSRLKNNYEFLTGSDCEVILALYREKGTEFLDELNGIFAFALYDSEKDDFLIARDHIGIVPLYMGWDRYGQFFVASELKALEGVCHIIREFPPGHYLTRNDNQPRRWYHRQWMEYAHVKNAKTNISDIRRALEEAVHRQLMSDVPYGVLLSGGLDSSIIAAITSRFAGKRIESGDTQIAWWPRLHSFVIGLEGSPDMKIARKVAEHIGSVHHEIRYSIQEGLDALSDVIYHIETYDVTTVRASTPMYLMARVIRSMGIKMVLTGEGSDEIFGGYLYFHKAPDARSFHDETVRKLSRLHWYDCLRANKSMAAWGVEARVPFLDKEFIDVAMSINPLDKMSGNGKMEKWILRKAFEDLLPHEVVWRQKEQFSDGVGYGWIDTLKKLAEETISDDQMKNASYRFPVNPPLSKEEYLYREMFTEHFPSYDAAACVPSVPSVACSTAEALEWDANFRKNADPSGRSVLDVHQSHRG